MHSDYSKVGWLAARAKSATSWVYENLPPTPTACVAATISGDNVHYNNSGCETPRPFVCKLLVVSCGPPLSRQNMQMTGSNTTVGSSFEYRCDTGYTPNTASGKTTCQADGSWTDIGLECTVVSCGQPPSRQNMQMTGSNTTVGGSVMYSCDTGHTQNTASGETTCQADGTWTDIGLECTVVSCGPPPSRQNMQMGDFNSTFGSSFEYRCDTGYTPNTASGKTTCQADKSWTDIGLECTAIRCDIPPTRPNMQVTGLNTTFGSSAVYHCATGYTPNTASGETKCQADGSWTDVGLECTNHTYLIIGVVVSSCVIIAVLVIVILRKGCFTRSRPGNIYDDFQLMELRVQGQHGGQDNAAHDGRDHGSHDYESIGDFVSSGTAVNETYRNGQNNAANGSRDDYEPMGGSLSSETAVKEIYRRTHSYENIPSQAKEKEESKETLKDGYVNQEASNESDNNASISAVIKKDQLRILTAILKKTNNACEDKTD
ncbi:hypothetical protein ScPMuIL_016390 [Solemya velum]